MNNKIKKLQQGDYFQWNNLSREDKVKRNKQIAKQYLDKGPSIQNYYNALKAYFGGFNPKNPYLITGEAPSPGWGKQGVTGLHKMMAKLPEAKQTLLAPLAGRSRAATIIKDKNIVEAQKHRDEVYRRWASLYKQKYDPTPTTFRTKPAKIKRQETNVANSNAKTLAGGKGNAGGSYSSKSHTIRVTTSNKTSAENLEDIAFHEGIHSYGLGESPSYVWKSKYLNFPEGTNPYFLDPREIAAHGIQQGQNLGIKVGQTYPGRKAMIKIIENRPEGQGFGGVPMILYNNAKTNSDYRRLWSLLNGTFKDGGVITVANARKWKHKDGGVLYIFQEGGKTSWWNKAINFVNDSGLGEAALNALSTYTQNKQIGASSDVAKAQVDKDKASKIQQANLAAEQEARNIQQNNINPENPNAMSGDIVKNFIKNKLLSQKMALINQESNQEKAEIDWQTQQLKNQNTTNMLSGIGNILYQGLGHVGQYMGNKQQTNVNNT